MVGLILCKYDCRSGDLFVRSCASVRRMLCVSVFSELLIGGGGAFSILLRCVCVYVCTICVWMIFLFCFMVSSVVFCGVVSKLYV